jgi:hypothetical protein
MNGQGTDYTNRGFSWFYTVPAEIVRRTTASALVLLSLIATSLHHVCILHAFEAEARLNNFKNSVRTAKKTHLLTVTKINLLMVFKEIISVYSENHTKPVNTK